MSDSSVQMTKALLLLMFSTDFNRWFENYIVILSHSLKVNICIVMKVLTHYISNILICELTLRVLLTAGERYLFHPFVIFHFFKNHKSLEVKQHNLRHKTGVPPNFTKKIFIFYKVIHIKLFKMVALFDASAQNLLF